MRVLVCNDDGIDAPGLRVLAAAATTLTSDVWVVAPERKWTAASHQLSFDRVLTLTRVGEREYKCSGAPADCAMSGWVYRDGTAPPYHRSAVIHHLNAPPSKRRARCSSMRRWRTPTPDAP